jgi:hypothetical protein
VGQFIDPDTHQPQARKWSNPFPNFDNLMNSLTICFMTSSMNGFTEVMTRVR